MKEIKTITVFMDRPSHSEDFDRVVNGCIRQGYTLIKREFCFSQCTTKNPCLYAELEREVEEE